MEGTKDVQTVRSDGSSVLPLIAGVKMRHGTTQIDDRGEVCEIFSPAWGLYNEPLIYLYQTMIRPGVIKGWVYHKEQDDRLFISAGTVKIVLYDPRDDSPTKGMVNQFYLSDRNRGLVRIPRLVLHAVQNVGVDDAIFINLPTKPYNHADPDKYRVPLNSKDVLYTFRAGTDY